MHFLKLRSCGNAPSSTVFQSEYSVRQAHLHSSTRVPGAANVSGTSKAALLENLKIHNNAEPRIHGKSSYVPYMYLNTSESEFDLEALVQEHIDNDNKRESQKKKHDKKKASMYEKHMQPIQVDVPHVYLNGSENDFDLEALVQEYTENDDEYESQNKKNAKRKISTYERHIQSIQMLLSQCTSSERQIKSIISILSAAINCKDLPCCSCKVECKGICIHKVLVAHLRRLGYDAAACSSTWNQFGRVPAGEYQYMDVIMNSDSGGADRLIIDVDFVSQFQIARPTLSYMDIVRALPVVFVGSVEKLYGLLSTMSKAVALSMNENDMPVPPWRTFDYMKFKWLSASPTRLLKGEIQRYYNGADNQKRNQCVRKLEHLKLSVNNLNSSISDHEKGSTRNS